MSCYKLRAEALSENQHIKPIKVLLAEDEDTYRQVISRRLSESVGFEVTTVSNGVDALKLISKFEFDVVVLDHMMPEMTGLQVLQSLLEQKSDVPVIVLTGVGSENIATEAMKLGAYDYIAKHQLDPAHLPIHIRGVHERHQFRRAKEELLAEERDKLRSLAWMEQLKRAASSIEHVANTTLAIMSLALEECEQELKPLMRAEGSTHLERTVRMMKQDHRLLTLTFRSLMDLSAALSAKLSDTPPTVESAQDLERQLQAIQERMAAFQDPNES